MNINLPTGNTISISVYEWLFIIKDEDILDFYQACVADNLGTYIDNPFSNTAMPGRVEYEEVDPETEE